MALFLPIAAAPRSNLIARTALVGILIAGTGGMQQVDAIGYSPSNMRVSIFSRKSKDCSFDLICVKNSFKVTITGLSKVFGISRQAIYNWAAGEAPNQTNHAKIIFLAHVGRILGTAGATSKISLDQPLIGGKTLFQLAGEGSEPDVIARQIVDINQRKDAKRYLMAERLGAKRRRGVHIDLLDAEIG